MGDRIAEIPADPGRDPMPRARLIAAAPDLLAALKAMTKGFSHRAEASPREAALIAQAEAAIAKAGA